MERGELWCEACCEKNGVDAKENMALLIKQSAELIAAVYGDDKNSVSLASAEGPAICSECGRTFWISSRY